MPRRRSRRLSSCSKRWPDVPSWSRSSRRPVKSVALALLTMVLVVISAGPASAHTTLLESTPSDGSVVGEGPAEVVLRYDQPVGISAGSVKVLAPDGTQIDAGQATQRDGGRIVVKPLKTGLTAGTYTILWRVLSADSHAVFGAGTFSVKTVSRTKVSTAAAEAEQASGGAVAESLLTVSRVVYYLGLVLLVGGLMFLLVLWPEGRNDRSARRLLWMGWSAANAGTIGGLLMQGPYSQGLGLYYTFDPELIALVLPTRFGVTSVVRLVLLAATAVVLARLVRTRRGVLAVVGGTVSLGLLVSTSAIGHSGAGDLVGFALSADVLHLAAASAWIGGLALLAVVLLRRPPATLGRVLPRWSRYAESSVFVLVVTGSFAAWREVRELDAVPSTTYGRLLLVKVSMVIVILVLGAMGRSTIYRHHHNRAVEPEPIEGSAPETRSRRPPGVLLEKQAVAAPAVVVSARPLAPLLRRTVLVEAALAVVVLAVTAVLVSTTPARESYFPVSSQDAQVTSDLQMQVDVEPARAGLNDMSVSYQEKGGAAVDVVRVTASWRVEGGNTIVPVTLLRTAVGHYSLPRVQLPDVGTWRLAVDTQTSDIDSKTNLFTVRIR